jgi:hypothetical protein
MKHSIFLSFLFLLSAKTFAQTDPLTQVHGAQNQSIGNIRVFGSTAWSYFNNPGVLAMLEVDQIVSGYDHRFGLKELNTYDLAASLRSNFGTFGFGVTRFGGKLFNQQSLGIAFANQLGIVSFGGKVGWFQTQIEGFGSGNSLIFSVGGIAELDPKLSLGATIGNLTRAKLGKNSDQRLPTGISLGLAYNPIDQLQFFAEVEKDIQISAVYKFGLEYGIKEWIALRTGINSNPAKIFFGLGLKHERFGIDFGYGQNNPLGSTTHLSLSYSWD